MGTEPEDVAGHGRAVQGAVSPATEPADGLGLMAPAPLAMPLAEEMDSTPLSFGGDGGGVDLFGTRGEDLVGGPANVAGDGVGDGRGQAAAGPGDAGQGVVGFRDSMNGFAGSLENLDNVADLMAWSSPGATGEDGAPGGGEPEAASHRWTTSEETTGEAVGPLVFEANDDGALGGIGAARRGGGGQENLSAARGGGPGASASAWTAAEGAVQEAAGGEGGTGLHLYAQPLPASDPGAPAAPAASRVSVMQQLAGHLQEMVAEMRQEITPGGVGRVAIRLHPEYLGEVVLRISVDRSGTVTAQFAVDNPQVRAWIEEDLPQLRAALAEHGLQLADANVDSGSGYGHENLFAFGEALAGWGSNHTPARFAEERERANLAAATSSQGADEGDGDGNGNGRLLAAYGIATIVDLRA